MLSGRWRGSQCPLAVGGVHLAVLASQRTPGSTDLVDRIWCGLSSRSVFVFGYPALENIAYRFREKKNYSVGLTVENPFCQVLLFFFCWLHPALGSRFNCMVPGVYCVSSRVVNIWGLALDLEV